MRRTHGTRVEMRQGELRILELDGDLLGSVLLDERPHLGQRRHHHGRWPRDEEGRATVDHLEAHAVFSRQGPHPARQRRLHLGRYAHLLAAVGVLLEPRAALGPRLGHDRGRARHHDGRRELLHGQHGWSHQLRQLRQDLAVGCEQQLHLRTRAGDGHLLRPLLREEGLERHASRDAPLPTKGDAVPHRLKVQCHSKLGLEAREQSVIVQAELREQRAVIQ
mmetsp:Transcript_17354/g.56774  ORF Transcript_17354/g.56774 Transcript_17354/m.56774 type:complete len:221 (-) Transcript_17354:2012-2674(-)